MSTADVVVRETDDMKHVRVTGTEGSKLNNLVIECDQFRITIACTDSYHATRLFRLLDDASWIEVEAKATLP